MEFTSANRQRITSLSRYFFYCFLFLFLIQFSFALPEDTPASHLVNDYANLLSESDKEYIAGPLKALYDSGKAQYAIVIVQNLDGYDIATYGYLVAEGNIGDSVTNNGLLLLVAIDERRYRFETGRGLEVVLPDILLDRIGREYLEDAFRRGEYATGLYETSLAIQAIIEEDTESNYYATVPKDAWYVTFLKRNPYFVFFIVVFIISLFMRKRGRGDDELFNALMMVSMFGRGGNRGSGGFGGFGGGSFGGGGNSGGW